MVSFEEAYLDRIESLAWDDPRVLVPHYKEVFSDGIKVTQIERIDSHSRLELVILEHWPNAVDILSPDEVREQQNEMRKRNNQITVAFKYRPASAKKPLSGYELFTQVVDKIFASMEERDTNESHVNQLVEKLKRCRTDEEREKVHVDFKPLAIVFDNGLLGRSNYGGVLVLDPAEQDIIEKIGVLYGWDYADARYMDFSGFGISETPDNVSPPNFKLPSPCYREETRRQFYSAFIARIESIFSSICLCVEKLQSEFLGDDKSIPRRNISLVYGHNGKKRMMTVSLIDKDVFITGYVPEFVYKKLNEDLVRKTDDATL